ncbi:MAG: hypothetical protein ACJAYR_000925 [Sneathiella sp.]|jgi:hypothetical protein
MKKGRYHFDLLYRHSNELSLETRRTFKNEVKSIKEAFGFLDQHLAELEKSPKNHHRNVKMALTARFLNHLFSYVILTERGLILDASNCGRSATETTAFYWLVCKDPSSSSLYDKEQSPRPIDVRKKLEAIGVDVSELRDKYGFESNIAHVGNKYDNLQISWEKQKSGSLHIGGGGDVNTRREYLQAVSHYIYMFVLHDPNYVVTNDAGN